MSIFFSVWNLLPFLDIVIEPRFTPTPTVVLDQVIEPQPLPPDTSFTGLLLIVLVLFLAFIGCLIWNALKKKK